MTLWHLDPRTVMIAIIVGEAVVGAALLVVARGPLGEIKGASRWAAATLTHATGWLFFGVLRGVVPDLVSIVVGNGLLVLGLGLGLTVLAELSARKIQPAWIYALVTAQSLALLYFTVAAPNVAARIVVASACGASLLLSCSHVLWAGRAGRPMSDTLTAVLFATTGLVLAARAVYTVVWNPDPNQSPMAVGTPNDVLYIIFFANGVLASFGFLLMISDRYVLKNAAVQALLERTVEEKGAALNRMRAQQEALGEASSSDAFIAGDVERMARRVTELAAHTVEVERATVWLFNEKETELRCIDRYERSAGRHSSGGALREADYGPEFAALKKARFVDADDALTDPRTAGYVESLLRPLGITSMLDAVIEVSGHRLGLLCLQHVERPHHWERDEVDFACQLADKVALSLVNRARRDTQETLRASEARYRLLFESAKDGILILDAPTGLVVDVNPFLADLVGQTREQILDRRVWDLAFLEKALGSEAAFRDMFAQDFVQSLEIELVASDGRRLDAEFRSSGYSLNGKLRIQCNLRDVTARKAAALALRESVEEQKALLKEVHHRVKNNLQVISSLLRLESGRSAEGATRGVLKEMQGRILSMALLHETLYRSGRFGRVDLAVYLRQLAEQFFRGQSFSSAVRMDLDLHSAEVGIDQAIPCGLIVNELLTNSLKHGFRDGRDGRVRVSVGPGQDQEVRLSVGDDGVGLPADLGERSGKSLGLQLVSDLARQLGGRLEMGPAPEAIFTVTFVPAQVHNSGPIPRPSPSRTEGQGTPGPGPQMKGGSTGAEGSSLGRDEGSL